MKKVLLTTLLLMSASGMAMAAPKTAKLKPIREEPVATDSVKTENPSNPFYTPKKGTGLLSVESSWKKYNDLNEKEKGFDSSNAVQGAGMYGVTDNLAVIVRLADEESRFNDSNDFALMSGDLSSSPSVGIKYVMGVGPARIATEANYGFNLSEGKHDVSYDSVDAKLTVGFQEGPLTVGAYAKYAYLFDVRDDGYYDMRNAKAWYYGLETSYQATEKLSVELGWNHQFDWKAAYANDPTETKNNEVDTFKVGATYKATDRLYIAPYVKYYKLADGFKKDYKKVMSYGVKASVTF